MPVALLFLLRQLGHLAVLATLAWGCGQLLLGRLFSGRLLFSGQLFSDQPVPGRWSAGQTAWRGLLTHTLAAALGLLLLAQLSFVLGLLGLLVAPAIATLAVLLAGLGTCHWHAQRRDDDREATKQPLAGTPSRTRGTWVRPAVALGFGAFALPWFLAALFPPHAFDELTYHLPFARAFAETGALPFLPQLRFPVFPILADALFASGQLLADDLAPHLVSWLATVLTAALAAGWAARHLGTGSERLERQQAHAGAASCRLGSAGTDGAWLAGALVLGSPLVVYLATTAYVEPLLGLATIGAFLCLDRGDEGKAPPPPAATATAADSNRWLALAALFAASASAIKYSGLPVLLMVAIMALARSWQRRSLRPLAIVAVVTLFAAVPTYWRNVALSGSPLFPYFPTIFGDSAWQVPLELRSTHELWEGRFTLLFDAVFRRERSGSHPPLSPLWLIALPTALWAAWRSPHWRPGAAFAVLSWVVLPPDIRYHAAVLPVLAAPAAWAVGTAFSRRRTEFAGGWRRWPEAGRGRLLVGLAVLALVPGAAYPTYRLLRLGPPPTDPATREAWLVREIPLYATLRAFEKQALGEHAGAAANRRLYVYEAEWLHGLARDPPLGEHMGPARYAELTPFLADPAHLPRELARRGAQAILLERPLPRGARGLACLHLDAAGAVLGVPRQGETATPCRLPGPAPTPAAP